MNIVSTVGNTLNTNPIENKQNIVLGNVEVIVFRVEMRKNDCLSGLNIFLTVAMLLSRLRKAGYKNTASSWDRYLIDHLNRMNECITRMVLGKITDLKILSYGLSIKKTLRARGLLIGSLITCGNRVGK